MPTAIRQRVFHRSLHQAFDDPARRRNDGLRRRGRERHAGGATLLRSMRISAHDRTRCSSRADDGEGGRHRQQRRTAKYGEPAADAADIPIPESVVPEINVLGVYVAPMSLMMVA